MSLSESDISCGVVQLHGLATWDGGYTTRDMLYDSLTQDDDVDLGESPFVVFSDRANSSSGGSKLEKYLLEYKLGRVIGSTVRNNPNSGNFIKVWIWEVDHSELRKWLTNETARRNR